MRILASTVETNGAETKRQTDQLEKYSVRLKHGSFLLMKSGLQEH
jgi:hypothetical protein